MTAVTAPIALRCPKCAGDLVTYERQGVHVDQCRDCRGVWLDRGELDHLIDAETAALARRDAWAVTAVRGDDRTPSGGAGRAPDHRGDRREDDRRGGFLGDLLGDLVGG